MRSSTQAVNMKCAIALCAASASLGLSAHVRAEDATGPTISDATHDETVEEAPKDADADEPPSPVGGYIASVTANGNRCPDGSWDAQIVSDDEVVLTFSSFEGEVDRTRVVSIASCQLNVRVNTPSGVAYAVKRALYEGYVYLEEGVDLRQVANYYFSGSPDVGREARSELVGPFDDTYLVEDAREEADLAFSPCGSDRNLQVRITGRVFNSPRRRGYFNVEKIRLSLVYARC